MLCSSNEDLRSEFYTPGTVERPLVMNKEAFGGRVESCTWSSPDYLLYASDITIQPGYSITLDGNEDLDIALIGIAGYLSSGADEAPVLSPGTTHWVLSDQEDRFGRFTNFGTGPCRLLQLWFAKSHFEEPAAAQMPIGRSDQPIYSVANACGEVHATPCTFDVRLLTLKQGQPWVTDEGDINYIATGSVKLASQVMHAGDFFAGRSGPLISTERSNILKISSPHCLPAN